MLTLLILISVCLTSQAYVIDTPGKRVYADGSFSDTTNALNYALSRGVDGWSVNTGTNNNTYNWAVDKIRVTYSNHFEFFGGAPTTNWANTNAPVINCSVGAVGGSPFVFTQTVPGKTITFHHFVFNEWNTNNSDKLMTFYGQGVDVFNVYALYAYHTDGKGNFIWVGDPSGTIAGNGPWGVIRSNVVDSSAGGTGYGIYVHENFTATSSAWIRDGMSFGTRSNVFIEYNSFFGPTLNAGSPAVDGSYGARVVFRYNTLTNSTYADHGADEDSTTTNSCLEAEVTHNIFAVTAGNSFDAPIRIRGGTAIIYGNTIYGGSDNHVISLNYYRATTGLIPSGIIDRHYPADYLGTQQPGMGVTLGAASQDPNFPTMPWVSWPIYASNNVHASGSLSFSFMGTDSSFAQSGRDFFTNALPAGYVEYTAPYPLNASDPSITVQPSNQTVTAPATATFSVTATGSAPLTYQWYKGGVSIAGATSSSYTTPATTYPTDNGSQFYVIVTSGLPGTLQSTTATLTVNSGPLARVTNLRVGVTKVGP